MKKEWDAVTKAFGDTFAHESLCWILKAVQLSYHISSEKKPSQIHELHALSSCQQLWAVQIAPRCMIPRGYQIYAKALSDAQNLSCSATSSTESKNQCGASGH